VPEGGGFCGRSSVRRVLPTDARPAGHPWPASAETPFPRHHRPSPWRDGRANRGRTFVSEGSTPSPELCNLLFPNGETRLTQPRAASVLRSRASSWRCRPNLAPRCEVVGAVGYRRRQAMDGLPGGTQLAGRGVLSTDRRYPSAPAGSHLGPEHKERSPPSRGPDVICGA
jgi:hypothetical protein